jgi:RNA polymerase sigma-70 factor (ECF subfamily)
MTDSSLLELFHSGARARAFKVLLDKYQQRLYWHIYRIVGESNTDDVLQNTFIKAWGGLENFRSESQLFSWLYRIATNESITFLNKEKKHGHISFDSGTDTEDDENAFAPANYLKADDAELDGDLLQEKLKRAIDALPPKQKIVFNLRYYDELPYEEMSEILGTSVGALKASYHHAAQKVEHFILNMKD